MSRDPTPAEPDSVPREPIEVLERPQPRAGLVRWGVVATIAYLLTIGGYASFRFDDLLQMSPDEFGTFLAGVVSPLAFLWLVLGFFQQGEELRYSADALWLQGRELHHSVEQQRDLVGVTTKQFELERDSRLAAEKEADRAARPRFIVTSRGHSSSGDQYDFRFLITNVGAPCTHIQVKFDSDSLPFQEPALATHDALKFNLEFDHARPIADTEMTIFFIDSRGRAGWDRFSFKVGGTENDKLLLAPKTVLRTWGNRSEVESNI